MKRFVLTTLAAVALFGTAQAREVAFCGAGFDIQKVTGDKAVCQKTENYNDDIGPRNCLPATTYKGNENSSNGGDFCDSPGGVAGAPPAVMCEIDPTYVGRGAKTDFVRGGRDRCYVVKTRTVYGNVQTRQE